MQVGTPFASWAGNRSTGVCSFPLGAGATPAGGQAIGRWRRLHASGCLWNWSIGAGAVTIAHSEHTKAQATALLALGNTPRYVARKCGIPLKTVRRWRGEVLAIIRAELPDLSDLARGAGANQTNSLPDVHLDRRGRRGQMWHYSRSGRLCL
jgi:hypothetical protein